MRQLQPVLRPGCRDQTANLNLTRPAHAMAWSAIDSALGIRASTSASSVAGRRPQSSMWQGGDTHPSSASPECPPSRQITVQSENSCPSLATSNAGRRSSEWHSDHQRTLPMPAAVARDGIPTTSEPCQCRPPQLGMAFRPPANSTNAGCLQSERHSDQRTPPDAGRRSSEWHSDHQRTPPDAGRLQSEWHSDQRT
jgi:hypothetical protein